MSSLEPISPTTSGPEYSNKAEEGKNLKTASKKMILILKEKMNTSNKEIYEHIKSGRK